MCRVHKHNFVHFKQTLYNVTIPPAVMCQLIVTTACVPVFTDGCNCMPAVLLMVRDRISVSSDGHAQLDQCVS